MTEAGKILPVLARTLGFSGVGLPILTWSADVAAFMQGVTFGVQYLSAAPNHPTDAAEQLASSWIIDCTDDWWLLALCLTTL